MKYYISPPATSPFTRIVASLFTILAIAGAFIFGLFVLALVAGLGLLLWIGLTVRSWWQRRGGRATPGRTRRRDAEIIEAEYTVIARRRE